MKKLIFAALAWLALCLPSYAVISAPVDMGGCTNTTTVTSCNITTSATAPAGSTIFVVYQVANWSSITLSDPNNGAYTQFGNLLYNSTHNLGIYYHKNVLALNSGSTITISWTTAVACSFEAFYVTGLSTSAPADLSSAGASNASSVTTSGSFGTGTLSSANEILFAADALANTSGSVTSPTTPWNVMTTPAQGAQTTLLLYYQIVAVNTAPSITFTWTNARAFGASMFTFQAGASAGAQSSMGTTGAGY